MLRDRAQRGSLERELHLRIVFERHTAPAIGRAGTDVMKLVIREAPAAVTREAQALAIEELESALGRCRNRSLVTRDPAVERSLLRLDGALERGHCLHDRINVDGRTGQRRVDRKSVV